MCVLLFSGQCINTAMRLVVCGDMRGDDVHLSLQDGWTALMMAVVAGQVECVKVLLDTGAEVNMQDKVIGVIIHCVHAMQHVPRVPPISGGCTCVF